MSAPRLRLIGRALRVDDGPRFVRETALASGRIDIAADAREWWVLLSVAVDIAETIVTTARRAPSEPRIRMADAMQGYWDNVLDIEEPRLAQAIAAAVVTIGAALGAARRSSERAPSVLNRRLIDLSASVEHEDTTPARSTTSSALDIGAELARSFAWHSDVELARSGKFRNVLDRPGIASALNTASIPSDALEAARMTAAELTAASFTDVEDRFTRVTRHARTAEIPSVKVDIVEEVADIELFLPEDHTELNPERLVPANDPTDQRITVYFGTDRAEVTTDEYFTNRRDASDAMHYGIATVDVPESHRIGRRRRLKIGWRSVSWGGTTRLTNVIRLSHDDFLREMDREIHAGAAQEPRLLLFVHGFRTSFRAAMLTAGQFAADLGISGVTAAFSWPSANSVARYSRDRQEARTSTTHLVNFIVDLTGRTGVQSVDVVFHSMGSYLLAEASGALAAALASAGRQLGAVILAAPDVTPVEFQALAALRPALSAHGTMYATKRDRALGISGAMRGTPRAGSLPPVVAHREIDTIDATLVNESFIGHAYHSKSRTVISDIFYAVHGNPPRSRHGLDPRTGPTHWRIKG